MSVVAHWLCIVSLFGLIACGGADALAPPVDGGGGSLCGIGEAPRPGGGCDKTGVPPEACAQGFVPDDGGGCVAVLPVEACAPGTFAIPGETRCHEVAPCGTDRWGEIPVEAGTVYVDAAYGGGDGDGSEQKPYPDLQQAIDAAPPGALVAVAEGSYGAVFIDAPLRLWGRCPAKVSIASLDPDPDTPGIYVFGASGVELHTLSVTGASIGVRAGSSNGVLIDRLWLHDLGLAGMYLYDRGRNAPSSVTVAHTLVELTMEAGILAHGGELQLEASVLRDTSSRDLFGHGVAILANPEFGTRGKMTITSSILERNFGTNLAVQDSAAQIEASVIRDTRMNTEKRAIGVGIKSTSFRQRASATLRGCLVERNPEMGVLCGACEVTLETTTVRDSGSASAEPVGVLAQMDLGFTTRAVLAVHDSLVAQSRGFGILISGSTATVEGTRIWDTLPVDGLKGRGLQAQVDPKFTESAELTLRRSAIEMSRESGIVVVGATSLLEGVAVRDTLPQADGLHGDGIVAVFPGRIDTLTQIRHALVQRNSRVGIANFGAQVALEDVVLDCNLIALNAETRLSTQPSFSGVDMTVCGCDGVTDVCRAVSSQLEPPGSLP